MAMEFSKNNADGFKIKKYPYKSEGSLKTFGTVKYTTKDII